MLTRGKSVDQNQTVYQPVSQNTETVDQSHRLISSRDNKCWNSAHLNPSEASTLELSKTQSDFEIECGFFLHVRIYTGAIYHNMVIKKP